MSSARASGGTRTRARKTQSSEAGAATQEVTYPGLRTLVQQRLLKGVFETASSENAGWKVLIIDDHSMRVVSTAVGMYDIMERKITIVESLTKKRAPFPDMAAVYILEPSYESVSRLLDDYQTGKVLYGNAVFLFFLSRLPDNLLNQIKMCKPLVKRIKGLCEINVDLLAVEERSFTFDMRDAFASFYLRKTNTPAEIKIAEKLVTACATLNEYPHIRYKQSSAICTSLASVFHLKMDEFVAQNPSWWYHGGPQRQAATRERGVLLLLDRADDCLTPLMHDFHYQTMVHDLLPMDGDKITIKTEDPSQSEAKDVLLDEKDNLWVELRGKHIAQVIEILSERIREITSSATGNAFGKNTPSGTMSLSQMASALKALPEYREIMSKLSQHMHLSHECMDVFKQQNLLELSELEQTLSTGKDEDGRTPKLTNLIDTAERLISQMKDARDRLRLMLIVTISQGGLSQQDRRRLMTAADLSRKDMRTLNSLEILGLSIFASNEKNRIVSMLTGGRASTGNQSDDEAEYAASRYIPPLRQTLEAFVSNDLSMEDYPSLMPMPEMGSSGKKGKAAVARQAGSARGAATSARQKTGGATSRWSKSGGDSGDGKGGAAPTSFTGNRSMVFMVGGISYAELRVARQVMANETREIIIGSNAFVSAKQFVQDLEALGQEEE